MRRAWSNARRRIGVEPSSKTGVETVTKKLMGKSCVQESNELPKCQDESAASSVLPNPETVDLESAAALRGLDRLGVFSTHGRNRLAIGGSRRRVVFGVLVVVILGQRSIDEIQNHSRNVDLPAIEKLERFLGQTGRGVGEPDNKERGVDFWGETRGIVRRQNGRTVDDDVIVVLINFFQERFSRLAQEMFARLGQGLATR